MRDRIITFLCIIVLASVSGCSKGHKDQELLVLAAASLSTSFEQIKMQFESENPDIHLIISYGPSGGLAKQIEIAAPADIFASAGQKEMDRLEAKGLLQPDSRFDFARNEICLITCKDITINFWEDLLKEEIHRIGIGGPVAPVGDYARSLLESKKLADKIADKLIPGKDVRQVVDYVLRGEVEAALVYRTDANRFSSRGEYQIADLPIAPSDHPPIRYPVAIPESSSKQADAQKFIDFLLSEQAQTLLAEEGFIRIDS